MSQGSKSSSPDSPPAGDFPWYLGAGSLWIAGQRLQDFLVPWLLVGVLATSPTWVGYAQLLIALPGFAFMLLGGMTADRIDGRRMLLVLQGVAVVFPLILALVVDQGLLQYWWVVACGIGVSAMMSTTEPPRAALLSRVTRSDVQRAVTLYTAVSTLLGLLAMRLGGELESVGLVPVLVVQATLFLCASLGIARISKPVPAEETPAPTEPPWRGFRLVATMPLVRDITLLSLVSAVFNAGAYFVVLPFVVTRVYQGDALFFANVLILFWLGSIISNLLLYRIMPLARPGQLFLLMQVSRVLILLLLWLQPPVAWMMVLVFLWGMNQGVTTPVSRSIVQELAPASHRARILSVFMMGFLAAAPLGSVVLGWVIEAAGPINALLPGALASVLLFVWGILRTGLWRYQPDQEPRQDPAG